MWIQLKGQNSQPQTQIKQQTHTATFSCYDSSCVHLQGLLLHLHVLTNRSVAKEMVDNCSWSLSPLALLLLLLPPISLSTLTSFPSNSPLFPIFLCSPQPVEADDEHIESGSRGFFHCFLSIDAMLLIVGTVLVLFKVPWDNVYYDLALYK